MLADISSVDAIYIVCGRTDMRKSIDGLCAIIQEQFSMEIDHALFLFCGRKCVNNPVSVSLLSGDRKPQIRF